MTDFIDLENLVNHNIDASDDNFVDFSSNISEPIPPPIKEKQKPPANNYDHDTLEKYRVMRLRKMDPISLVELDVKYAFKFKYSWDPYTGERQQEDPNGALYFDPDILIKYFYTKRLNKLWCQPTDDQSGYYQAYYDDGVGAGEDFFIAARGFHPEWYIFRLPILDCYLTKNHNKQFITFGPKLTDDEIIELERLANLRPTNYKHMFGHNRPHLSEMKKLYDTAISKTPHSDKAKNISGDELQSFYNSLNRQAVDILVKMRG